MSYIMDSLRAVVDVVARAFGFNKSTEEKPEEVDLEAPESELAPVQ